MSCSTNSKQSLPASQNIHLPNNLEIVSPGQSVSIPQIPFSVDKAFFPLRRDVDGKLKPSYQWRVCKKKFVVCIKWEAKRVFFEDLEWFYLNGFGLTKRRKP
jgi:hypothetical protein